MRIAIWVLCVIGCFATEGSTQTIRCQLYGEEFAYGLFGTCIRERATAIPDAGLHRVRFWPADGDVTVVIASRPRDTSPWRGYFFQQDGPQTKWGDSFEISREREAPGDRLVLRSMVGWVIVDEWRTTEAGPSTSLSLMRRRRPLMT